MTLELEPLELESLELEPLELEPLELESLELELLELEPLELEPLELDPELESEAASGPIASLAICRNRAARHAAVDSDVVGRGAAATCVGAGAETPIGLNLFFARSRTSVKLPSTHDPGNNIPGIP